MFDLSVWRCSAEMKVRLFATSCLNAALVLQLSAMRLRRAFYALMKQRRDEGEIGEWHERRVRVYCAGP
jgi:hypothetical protein